MTQKEFLNQISELLAEGEPVENDTRLMDLSGWDSIGKLTLVALISDVTKGPFNVGQLKEFRTVKDILIVVADKFEVA